MGDDSDAVDQGIVVFVRGEPDVGDAAEFFRVVEAVEPAVEGGLGAGDGKLDFDAVKVGPRGVGGEEFLGLKGEAGGGDFLFGEFLKCGLDRLVIGGRALVGSEPFDLGCQFLAVGADHFGGLELAVGSGVLTGDVELGGHEVLKTEQVENGETAEAEENQELFFTWGHRRRKIGGWWRSL